MAEAKILPLKRSKFPGHEGVTGRHPGKRPFRYEVGADGVATIYTADGKIVGFGPADQVRALFYG